ncbi:MAG: CoA transferase [Oscillospiraceae bacterium]|nr:CoA transferase [Oscillospiraceae bacterium]
MDNSRYPMTGVKVIELATVVAAPSATRILAAYGAEVIKVESLHGDDLRYVGGYFKTPCEDYRNPTFTSQNSNKKLIALNLKDEESRAALFRLLQDADIFVTNLREDALGRLGLDYETLKGIYPGLIYAHLTGLGTAGPDAKAPGYDMTVFWGRIGALCDWSEDGGAPALPTYGFGDNATGMALLSGILMALYGRSQTGNGTYVSTSLLASGIWYSNDGLIHSQFIHAPQYRDLLHPPTMFNTVYRCGDGRWLTIYATAYDQFLPRFAKAMDMEDLLEDPRFQSYESLHASGAIKEGVERCQKKFLQRTASEWKQHLLENGLACEVAQHLQDLCTDPQALANDYVKSVEFVDGLSVTMANPPFVFSAYEARPCVSCGPIGMDTESVLHRLGYTEEEIDSLRKRNAAL